MKALAETAASYNISLNEDETARLLIYFELVRTWNPRLHLVAPCSPTEFATRHVLESLVATRFIREGAHLVDIGSGAGLPIIPCLVVRPDASALLIESAAKKTVFLREALRAVGRQERAEVMCERFEKTPPRAADYLTCRALDRFTELFQKLLEWSAQVQTLLLFGGERLREQIEGAGLAYRKQLIPHSEQRFLFVVERGSDESKTG